MIVLFTDFGLEGPYVGQMKALLRRQAPDVPVIDLMHDAPAFAIEESAHLLAALIGGFAEQTVFLCVVDPGVGTAAREPAVLHADGRNFVGPDNGLLDVIAGRAEAVDLRHIQWRPHSLSASFHGRDIFAPIAARIATRQTVATSDANAGGRFTPTGHDLARVIYIDRFGNAITGLRAALLAADREITAGAYRITHATTFGDVPVGQAFWYENSIGLVEIAVNRGSAQGVLDLDIGTPIVVGESS